MWRAPAALRSARDPIASNSDIRNASSRKPGKRLGEARRRLGRSGSQEIGETLAGVKPYLGRRNEP